jgi:peptidoglycan/LPS O-acetylase OafA/YrhL
MSGESSGDRVHGLDLVRGICALAVCLYHVFLWTDSAELHTMGTYGVYIFFVVSGTSLYIGYADRYSGTFQIRRFFARRFLRLAPLYAGVVCFWMLLALILNGDVPGVWTFFLNVSLLFGFADPGESSIVTGGWSIGIEVVFYALFPLMLSLVRSRFWLALLVAAFVSQHAYIQSVLEKANDLPDVWADYTEPLSFIFYFLAGLCLARAMKQGKLPRGRWCWFPAVLLLVALFSIPSTSYKSVLIGPAGWALSLIAVLIAVSAAGLRLETRGMAMAELMGGMSYGLYLIHPFVYGFLIQLAPGFVSYPLSLALCTALASGALGLMLARFYEKPVRSWLESKVFDRPGRGRSARRQRLEQCLWVSARPLPDSDDRTDGVVGQDPHGGVPK